VNAAHRWRYPSCLFLPIPQHGGTAPNARRGAWAGQGGGGSGVCAHNYQSGRASLPATNSLIKPMRLAHRRSRAPVPAGGNAAEREAASCVPITTDYGPLRGNRAAGRDAAEEWRLVRRGQLRSAQPTTPPRPARGTAA
jgi:hypothetical protein